MNSNQEMLNRNFNELIELKHVLHTDDTFFAAVPTLRSFCICFQVSHRHQASPTEASIVETEEQQNQRLLSPSSETAAAVKLGYAAALCISMRAHSA